MSILPSSDLPASSIEDTPDCAADARVHIRMVIETSKLAAVSAEVIRLAERFMPGVPHFLTIDGDSMTLLVQHSAFRVCQTDMLACRLARTHGISHVNAEQKTTAEGVVYRALLRGRSRL